MLISSSQKQIYVSLIIPKIVMVVNLPETPGISCNGGRANICSFRQNPFRAKKALIKIYIFLIDSFSSKKNFFLYNKETQSEPNFYFILFHLYFLFAKKKKKQERT